MSDDITFESQIKQYNGRYTLKTDIGGFIDEANGNDRRIIISVFIDGVIATDDVNFINCKHDVFLENYRNIWDKSKVLIEIDYYNATKLSDFLAKYFILKNLSGNLFYKCDDKFLPNQFNGTLVYGLETYKENMMYVRQINDLSYVDKSKTHYGFVSIENCDAKKISMKVQIPTEEGDFTKKLVDEANNYNEKLYECLSNNYSKFNALVNKFTTEYKNLKAPNIEPTITPSSTSLFSGLTVAKGGKPHSVQKNKDKHNKHSMSIMKGGKIETFDVELEMKYLITDEVPILFFDEKLYVLLAGGYFVTSDDYLKNHDDPTKITDKYTLTSGKIVPKKSTSSDVDCDTYSSEIIKTLCKKGIQERKKCDYTNNKNFDIRQISSALVTMNGSPTLNCTEEFKGLDKAGIGALLALVAKTRPLYIHRGGAKEIIDIKSDGAKSEIINGYNDVARKFLGEGHTKDIEVKELSIPYYSTNVATLMKKLVEGLKKNNKIISDKDIDTINESLKKFAASEYFLLTLLKELDNMLKVARYSDDPAVDKDAIELSTNFNKKMEEYRKAYTTYAKQSMCLSNAIMGIIAMTGRL